MILEVVKRNNSIPVGERFKFNENTGMYESMKRHEDIGDDYELIRESRVAFSPSFYAFNEEIFNQVKLEEENEDNKNIEVSENKTDSEEGISSISSLRANHISNEDSEKEMVKEEMGKDIGQGDSGGESDLQEGPEREVLAREQRNTETSRFDELESILLKMGDQFDNVFSAFDDFIREARTRIYNI